MTKEGSHIVAETIGKSYAYVQHGVDRVIGWGFEQIRDIDRKETKPSGKIMRAGKKAVAFLGKAGDAYYKTYDALKNKK